MFDAVSHIFVTTLGPQTNLNMNLIFAVDGLLSMCIYTYSTLSST